MVSVKETAMKRKCLPFFLREREKSQITAARAIVRSVGENRHQDLNSHARAAAKMFCSASASSVSGSGARKHPIHELASLHGRFSYRYWSEFIQINAKNSNRVRIIFAMVAASAYPEAKKSFPVFVPPMTANSVKEPFDSPDWIFEMKLDS